MKLTKVGRMLFWCDIIRVFVGAWIWFAFDDALSEIVNLPELGQLNYFQMVGFLAFLMFLRGILISTLTDNQTLQHQNLLMTEK